MLRTHWAQWAAKLAMSGTTNRRRRSRSAFRTRSARRDCLCSAKATQQQIASVELASHGQFTEVPNLPACKYCAAAKAALRHKGAVLLPEVRCGHICPCWLLRGVRPGQVPGCGGRSVVHAVSWWHIPGYLGTSIVQLVRSGQFFCRGQHFMYQLRRRALRQRIGADTFGCALQRVPWGQVSAAAQDDVLHRVRCGQAWQRCA